MAYVVLVLAAWRLSNLIANESGPFHMFRHLRQWAHRMCRRNRWCSAYGLYELVQCEYCNSMYIGTGLVVLYRFAGQAVVWMLAPFALSTTVILLKCTHEFLKRAA